MSRPNNEKVRNWKAVLIDGRPEHVVLEGGHALARCHGTQERRGMGVGQFAVFHLGRVAVFAGFL